MSITKRNVIARRNEMLDERLNLEESYTINEVCHT